MTIDWTQPVETTEDPPRPVRVLFDPRGVASAADMDGQLWWVTVDGDAIYRVGGGQITLRNVPPPKPEPVLWESWCLLTRDGVVVAHADEDEADMEMTSSAAGFHTFVEKRRIAWMSDGSPVEGK